ncbi:sodium/glucose cotransporter 4-like [Watersipora subatra]|uniref:sodium/glucose cotransporter 4-like n=1 Tax=Watersipora subatra TaxID=2589382 RepID=UPI00355C7F7D
MAKDGSQLEWPDYVVIAIHFALTVGVGFWAARRGSRGTAKGYFLAGRDMSWYLVGASLYVSNIGSSSFMGIGGAATANGIAVICYEFTAEIYAGALIIQYTLGWDKYLSVVALLAFTALYTIVGGLASVIFTDALQTVVILVGGFILSIMSLYKVGGYENMMNKYLASVSSEKALLTNSTCGMAPENFNHIFRDASDPNYPWPGVVFGANILSYWYFCTDQVLVQRLLSAKNTIHAKAGSIMAGYMKILPLFLMAWPGIIARVLFPEEVACGTEEECLNQCGIAQGCSNFAYVSMVHGIMPKGLRGLMLAAMLAALMSSLTSIFNSGSTVFTLDLWRIVKKNSSERELMIVGRIFVLIFTGVAVAWLPMVDQGQGGQLFNYVQSISSYLAPPVGAVYLMGVFSTRANEKGAFGGLLVGFIVGVSRMVADWALPAPTCGEEDTRPWIISGIHYLNFAIFLFGLSIIIIWAVSVMSKPPSAKELYKTTWWTKDCFDKDLELKLKEEEKLIADKQQKGEKLKEGDEQQTTAIKSCLLSWFCGIDQDSKAKEDADVASRPTLQSLKASKTAQTIVEINLVILITCGVFIWGFFA